MFQNDPQYYVALAIGAAVFLVLFAVLAYRTKKNVWLRREAQVAQPEQTSPTATDNALPKSFTNTAELASAAHNALEVNETADLIDLVSAMAGYGPTVSTSAVRDAAVASMKESLYGTFLRAFRTASMIPDSIIFDSRSVTELTGVSIDYLATREEMLAFLVRYAAVIEKFYKANASIPALAQQLPSVITMSSRVDKITMLHAKFYA